MPFLRSANSLAAAVVGIALAWCGAAMGADTVQINIKSLLNARSVSTFSNGKIYTWTMGIDGGGHGNGYVTHSVAANKNYTAGPTLPDSARFPANRNHPTMLLNYSNSDSTHFQTHYLSGSDSVTFSVPSGNYSTIYLALTSSEGSTTIGVVLTYSDGPVTSTFTLPDYDQGLTSGVFYVDSGMQKWSNTNSPGDNFGHNLNGFGVTANSTKTLTSVKLVKKTTGSYLVFWGATGVGPGITGAVRASDRIAPSGALSAVRCAASRNAGIQLISLPADTRLTLYSAAGKTVAHAVSANGGSVTFDRGVVNSGAVPTGVYFCELRSGNAARTIRVIAAK